MLSVFGPAGGGTGGAGEASVSFAVAGGAVDATLLAGATVELLLWTDVTLAAGTCGVLTLSLLPGGTTGAGLEVVIGPELGFVGFAGAGACLFSGSGAGGVEPLFVGV